MESCILGAPPHPFTHPMLCTIVRLTLISWLWSLALHNEVETCFRGLGRSGIVIYVQNRVKKASVNYYVAPLWPQGMPEQRGNVSYITAMRLWQLTAMRLWQLWL